jgi:CheY-like chemotaxis protein
MDDLEGKVPQIEGNFTALSLVSLIQGISTNKRMLITLYSIEGNEGRLYFENSRIVGAFVGDELTGKKAFFRMIEWEDARFQAYDITDIDPSRINIDLEVSHLLLEGLRQKDEKAKIRKRILPIYKITKSDGSFDLNEKEAELFNLIPADGVFVNSLVNQTSMTDWEAYTTLSSLMIKRGITFVKIKTLVIDDSEFMTKIVKDILDNLYKDILIIKTMRDGAEAVKLIESPEMKVRPDLIFTDILMEGTGGMEVIKAARSQNPPILTIAVTSLQREMKDILDAGANYLHKNWITKDNIGEIMRDLLERTICGETGVIGGESYIRRTGS